ncbi:alpha/beta hydrolase [Shewanella cyperi]|uniref:alpha/beta hydrolase n=1 Tax=Shewanella cyperi TaxID=2814292 RepID=UPI001A9534BD|nr:alpha/beta hydrolase [Shewanella cyperi]QSX41381.1 alpha/beta hydrolase [Shewanella cyperi]
MLIRMFASVVLALCLLPRGWAAPSEPQEIVLPGKGIKLYLFTPEPGRGSGSAVVTVHGGGWKWGKAAWTFDDARRFASAGMLAVALEYRLSDEVVTPVDALEDVCDALGWVRENARKYQLDPKRVAAFGVSAGGHLSAMVASRGCGNNLGAQGNGGPDLLLLWSPALDMERDGWFLRLLPKGAAAADYSPLASLHSDMPPVTIVQGDRDTLTPAVGAKEYCRRLTEMRGSCEVNLYPGVGHLLTRNLAIQESDFDPDPVLVAAGNQALMEFLARNDFVATTKTVGIKE